MPKATFYGDSTGRVVASTSYRYPAIAYQRDVNTGRVVASFDAYGPGDS